MSETRGQPAHHRQPVLPAHGLFHLAQIGQVLEEHDLAGDVSLLQRRNGVAEDALVDAHFRAAFLGDARDALGQLRQQRLERLPAGGVVGEAGQLLGGAVQVGDLAQVVHREDAARYRADHRRVDGLQRL